MANINLSWPEVCTPSPTDSLLCATDSLSRGCLQNAANVASIAIQLCVCLYLTFITNAVLFSSLR